MRKRVLLACSLGGEGHLVPLVRVGRAIQAAGHQVNLLVPPALAPNAQRTGVPYQVGEEPPRTFVDDIWRRVRAGPANAVTGLIDRELFADRCTAAMLRSAREARDSWRPEFVVRDPCEYASAVVAHESGIPQAQAGISLSSVESGVLTMVTPIIERFAAGLAAAIASSPYLSSFPPSLDPSPWFDTRRFRTHAARGDVNVDTAGKSDQPLIYVTFGSVLGHLPEATAVFRCALEAVAVVCPLFADQLGNARIVQRAGAGLLLTGQIPAGGLGSLGPDDAAPLRERIEEVLEVPSYRRAALPIAAEIASLPTLDEVVHGLL